MLTLHVAWAAIARVVTFVCPSCLRDDGSSNWLSRHDQPEWNKDVASLHGIRVGTRAMFLQMNRAIDANGIKPVVHTVIPFESALDGCGCSSRAISSGRS